MATGATPLQHSCIQLLYAYLMSGGCCSAGPTPVNLLPTDQTIAASELFRGDECPSDRFQVPWVNTTFFIIGSDVSFDSPAKQWCSGSTLITAALSPLHALLPLFRGPFLCILLC